jgi:hypothetical protein
MTTNWHNEAVLPIADRAAIATASATSKVAGALAGILSCHSRNVTPESGETKLIEVPQNNP